MATASLKPEVCNKCGEPAAVKCKLCESVSYCSVNHQKRDWDNHRLVCEPYVILSDPLTGRTRWVATRKLHPGMILLQEDPLLSYPFWFSKHVNDEDNCIVCGKNFNGSAMKLCESCSWKLCNSFCEKRPEHVHSECRVFNEYEILRPNGEDNSKQVSSLIAVLRGLSLKSTDPEAYETLLSLPAETFHSPYEHQLKLDFESMLKFLKKYMNPLEVEEEEYNRVFRAIEINRLQYSSIDLVKDDVTMNGSNIRGSLHTNFYVYDQTSYLSHSCVPNCSWSIGPLPDRKIRIRVATEVAKGQELTIMKGFDPVYHECGTRERHLQFLRKRGILCRCPRCKDPTELGSYASAVTCFVCRYDDGKASTLDDNKGYLLPSNPLDFSPEAYYQCNNCDKRILATQVSKLEIRLQQFSEGICSEMVDRDNPYIHIDKSVTKIRNKLSELHPTHWIVTNSIRNIVAGISPLQIIVTRIHTGLKSRKYLENCILHLYRVLVQETKISPGINPFTATLQALLGTKLAILLLTFHEQLGSSEILRSYRLHKKYCLDALKFFEGDFAFCGKDVSIVMDHLSKTMDATAQILAVALEVHRKRK